MAKYNPANDQHQAWLAQNVLRTLKKWGFVIDEEYSETSWEYVCSRVDKYIPNKKIIIFTSIDKTAGAMRDNGLDRIRVVVKKEVGNETHATRIGRVNRVGEFRAITSRMCECIVKAQRFK